MAYLATKLTLTVTADYGRDLLKGRSSMTESGKHDRDTSPSVMDIFDFNEDEKCWLPSKKCYDGRLNKLTIHLKGRRIR